MPDPSRPDGGDAPKLPPATQPELLAAPVDHLRLPATTGAQGQHEASQQGAGGHAQQAPKHISKRAVWIGAICIVIVLVIVLLIGILPKRNNESTLRKRAEATAKADSVPEVSVQRVERERATTQLQLPGTIQAMHEAAVYARASGYIAQWFADIGARVRQGQLLARIDAPDVDAQLRQARADAGQAVAALQLAAAELTRWRIMYRDSVVTKEELDQKQAAYSGDSANVRSAEANVARLEDLVNFEQVKSPLTGIVTARNVDEGVLVSSGGATNESNAAGLGGNTIPAPSSGQANAAGATSSISSGSSSESGGSSASVAGGGSLFRVARIDTVRIYVGVPQSYARDLHPGLLARVTVREIANREFQGRVYRTASALDASSRTLLTEVDVVNPDQALLPGMYTQVNFEIAQSEPPILLPATALVVRTGGPQVAVMGRDSVVHIRDILVGRDYGATVEVDSGLVVGDLVVINASDDLRDGQHVRAVPAPRGGATGGATPGGRPENPPSSDSSKGKKGDSSRAKGGGAR